MSIKSLITLATVLCFGVGCDDPEVQDTVESVLEHGAVKAYAYCYTPVGYPVSVCSPPENQSIAFKATLFQDGSSFLQYRRTAGYSTSQVHSEFNPRGEPVEVSDFNGNGMVAASLAELDSGILTTKGVCSVSSPQIDTIDVYAEMTCTGFNLEAFGIEP